MVFHFDGMFGPYPVDFVLLYEGWGLPTSMHTSFTQLNSLTNGTESCIHNYPRLMSSANRKEFHNVDMKGNAQLYTVAYKFSSAREGTAYTDGAYQLTVSAAPNTYVTARAVKAWHLARKKMFERLGMKLSDLGTYGRTLRPYYDSNHNPLGNVAELTTQTSGNDGYFQFTPPASGEWTYSKGAMTVSIEEGEYSSQTFYPSDLVDDFSFHLLGEHKNETSGTVSSADPSSAAVADESYVSVGMIRGWLDSFKQKPQQSSSGSTANDVTDPDNPLLQLMADSISTEEVAEIVKEVQTELAPWDRSGDTYVSRVSKRVHLNHKGEDTIIMQVPCGLAKVSVYGAGNDADHETQLDIEVLDITDM